MSLRFKDLASESRAWQGKFVFKPVFQRASRGPPHFSSRPTNRTISKSGPLHKLKLSRTNARSPPGRGGGVGSWKASFRFSHLTMSASRNSEVNTLFQG